VLVREIVVAFCRLFWRVRVDGRQHIPARGPFILAPVHRSNIDTPLVAAVTRRRRLRYMGKDAMWKYPWSAWFFTSLGGFPVRRGSADREALRNAITVLERGEPLVLFPEGTRQSGPVVAEVFDGAAYVASRTGAPIVPVGIGGSEQAMPKGAKLPRPTRMRSWWDHRWRRRRPGGQRPAVAQGGPGLHRGAERGHPGAVRRRPGAGRRSRPSSGTSSVGLTLAPEPVTAGLP
jgi:1-acyl-sn-glycerol-3-phosphate acyltransferase